MRIQVHRGAAPAEARELRRLIFVGEQGVDPREEWDEHDAEDANTLHFVGEEGGRAVGCARLRRVGKAAKIERVAVLHEERGRGFGRELMEAAETEAWRRGAARLLIHAQVAVIPFYEKIGWCALGSEFIEAGIPHREMERCDAAAAPGEAWRRLGAGRGAWLRDFVDDLGALPGVVGVVLGGSFARGYARAGSDLDLGLLYRDARPIDVAAVRELAERWNDTPRPTVTNLYEWGPWVNGGAWLSLRGERVDLLYRSIDRIEREIAAAAAGGHETHFAQQPPFGFWSGTLLGECAIALPLVDPAGEATRLRCATAAYPEALRITVLESALRGATFGLAAFAPKFAARGDVWGTVACLSRAVWQLGLALFAWNHHYLVNDKTLLEEIDGFAEAPPDFGARADAVLAAPGRTPAALIASVEAIVALTREVRALTGSTGARPGPPPGWDASMG